MLLVPHIKFIEALVLSHKTIPEINLELEKRNLESVPTAYMQLIVSTVLKHQPQVISGDFPDFDWLKDYELHSMWSVLNKAPLTQASPEEIKAVEAAFEILDDPILFKIITSAALAKATEEHYSLILTSHINTRYTLEDIAAFLHYFFKIDKWNNKQKLDWIEGLHDQSLAPIYKLAMKGDVEYLLWKLGVRTDQLDYSFMMADMSRDAYWHFKENAKANPETAQKWGGLAVKFVEKAQQRERELTGGNALDEIQFQIKATIGKREITEEQVNEETQKREPFHLGFRKLEDLD